MQVAHQNVVVAARSPQAITWSVCVICTTVYLYFNWYRASRGSLGDSWASCLNNVTDLYLLTPTVRLRALQHGDRTIDYCDVTSAYLYLGNGAR